MSQPGIIYREVQPDGSVITVSEAELQQRLQDRWFSWLFEVGRIAGWTVDQTADRVNDVSWFGCFDDGMTPQQAYDEAKSKGVV